MTQSPQTQDDDLPTQSIEGWSLVNLDVYAKMALKSFEHLENATVKLTEQIAQFGVLWLVRCLQLWILLQILDHAQTVLSRFLQVSEESDSDSQEWEDRN